MQRLLATLSSPFSGNSQRGRSTEPIIISSPRVVDYRSSRSGRNTGPSHTYRGSSDGHFSSKSFNLSSHYPEASRRSQHSKRQSSRRHRYRTRSPSSDRSSERSRSSTRHGTSRHYRHSATSRGYYSRPHTPPRHESVDTREKLAIVRRAASLPRQSVRDEGYRSPKKDHDHKLFRAPSIHTQPSLWASDAPSRSSTVGMPLPDAHYVTPTRPPLFYDSYMEFSSPPRYPPPPQYPLGHYPAGHGPGLRHTGGGPSPPPLPSYPGPLPRLNDRYPHSSGPRSRFLSHSRPGPSGPPTYELPPPMPGPISWGHSTPYATSSTVVGDPRYFELQDFNTLYAGNTPLPSAVGLPRGRNSKRSWRI